MAKISKGCIKKMEYANVLECLIEIEAILKKHDVKICSSTNIYLESRRIGYNFYNSDLSRKGTLSIPIKERYILLEE